MSSSLTSLTPVGHQDLMSWSSYSSDGRAVPPPALESPTFHRWPLQPCCSKAKSSSAASISASICWSLRGTRQSYQSALGIPLGFLAWTFIHRWSDLSSRQDKNGDNGETRQKRRGGGMDGMEGKCDILYQRKWTNEWQNTSHQMEGVKTGSVRWKWSTRRRRR